MGDLAFIGEYTWRLGSRTYAWWNGIDNVPVLPPQVGVMAVLPLQVSAVVMLSPQVGAASEVPAPVEPMPLPFPHHAHTHTRQVWLGYQHFGWSTRWRIWNGTCAKSNCNYGTVLTRKLCTALDCPLWGKVQCHFNHTHHPMVRGRRRVRTMRAQADGRRGGWWEDSGCSCDWAVFSQRSCACSSCWATPAAIRPHLS